MKNNNMEEVAFFGKITASVTHELQNVLAIVQQSSGLMEDLISFPAKESDLFKEKLQNPLMVINRQIQRGSGLIAYLNQFSHNPDKSVTQADLYEMIEQIIALSRRFAALKKVTLTNHAPDQPIIVVINLIQLQMALFLSMECCLDFLAPGGQLHIKLEKQSKKVLIKLSCEGDFLCDSGLTRNLPGTSHWESLGQTLTSLNGSVEFDPSGNGIFLLLPVTSDMNPSEG